MDSRETDLDDVMPIGTLHGLQERVNEESHESFDDHLELCGPHGPPPADTAQRHPYRGSGWQLKVPPLSPAGCPGTFRHHLPWLPRFCFQILFEVHEFIGSAKISPGSETMISRNPSTTQVRSSRDLHCSNPRQGANHWTPRPLQIPRFPLWRRAVTVGSARTATPIPSYRVDALLNN